MAVLRRFQDGYRRRDLSTLTAWIEDLMAPDVFVLGTDGTWPGSWEWRGGHPAAREMFERDWRRWGSPSGFRPFRLFNAPADLIREPKPAS